jgi:uncharacterized protein YjbJ (UPF0337 family)
METLMLAVCERQVRLLTNPRRPGSIVPMRTSVELRAAYSRCGVFTSAHQRRPSMDWNRVEGNWKQIKGKVKEQWGKLTDDDLDVIGGKQEQLEGKLQERYGYQKDQVKKEIDDWYSRQTW